MGAGIGVGIGLPLLLGLSAFLGLWLREKRISQSLKRELEACSNPYYPILPSAWQANQERRVGKNKDSQAPAKFKLRYGRGQQELQGPLNLQQLPDDSLNAR